MTGPALKSDAVASSTPAVLWLSGKFVNLRKKSGRRAYFQVLQDGVKFPLVRLKSISKGQINKSALKLEMSKIPRSEVKRKKGRVRGLGRVEKPTTQPGSDPFSLAGPGAYLIR